MVLRRDEKYLDYLKKVLWYFFGNILESFDQGDKTRIESEWKLFRKY
jgi:hypothetical protein